jgi:hypothetical protein
MVAVASIPTVDPRNVPIDQLEQKKNKMSNGVRDLWAARTRYRALFMAS